MKNLLFQTICKVGIFMICAQTIVHFRPKEAYEKYLKLLVSMMILLLLFVPVCRFVLGTESVLSLTVVNKYQEFFDRDFLDAEENARKTEELLENMTLAEIRRRMEEAQSEGSEEAFYQR